MKRLITTLLVAILLVTSLTIAASAEGTVTVVDPGDEASLTVTVSNPNGFNTAIAKVVVDNTLTVTQVSNDAEYYVDKNNNTVYLTWDFNENVTSASVTIYVKVSENAAAGTYTGEISIEPNKVTVIVPGENGAAGTVEYTTASATCTKLKVECDHQWGAWTQTKAPTCTEKGEETRTCSLCETSESRSVDPIPHTFNQQVATDKYKATDATCTAKATYYYSCTCGAKGTETFEYGELSDHTYNQQVATDKYKATDATCTAKATYYYSCTCGAKGTETFEYGEKAEHKYGNWTVTKEATCKTDGEKTAKCSVCGAPKTEKIDKLTAHVWDDGKVTTAATCTKEGVLTYTCTKCGETKTEAIPATGHTIGEEWATDKDNHWHVCSVCGEKVDAAAHIFQWVVDKKATAKETGLQHEECETCHYKRNVGTVIPKVTDLDDVPQTGDITPHITFGVISVISMLAAVAFVFKRKAVK